MLRKQGVVIRSVLLTPFWAEEDIMEHIYTYRHRTYGIGATNICDFCCRSEDYNLFRGVKECDKRLQFRESGRMHFDMGEWMDHDYVRVEGIPTICRNCSRSKDYLDWAGIPKCGIKQEVIVKELWVAVVVKRNREAGDAHKVFSGSQVGEDKQKVIKDALKSIPEEAREVYIVLVGKLTQEARSKAEFELVGI